MHQEVVQRQERLDRLEGFLEEDPNNARLLGDAFDLAVQLALWDRAEFHLTHAQALGLEPTVWRLRQAQLRLAQKRWDDAREILLDLATGSLAPEQLAVVHHDIAYVDFATKDYASCAERMRLTGIDDLEKLPRITAELQVLWLRALHRLGNLEEAREWALKAESVSCLAEIAAGVASLIAFDLSDFPNALRWSNLTLARVPQMEALVCRASLVLGERNATEAIALAKSGLKLNANDGRTWSVKAFAELLLGDLSLAAKSFARALASMPEHVGTWHGLAWTQYLLKDIPSAQSSFETALAMDRNFSESHGGLAVILAHKQEKEQAQHHIELALRLDKSCLSARFAEAVLSGGVRDVQAFQRLAQRLLSARSGPLGGTMADWLPQSKTEADVQKDQPPPKL